MPWPESAGLKICPSFDLLLCSDSFFYTIFAHSRLSRFFLFRRATPFPTVTAPCKPFLFPRTPPLLFFLPTVLGPLSNTTEDPFLDSCFELTHPSLLFSSPRTPELWSSLTVHALSYVSGPCSLCFFPPDQCER